ncbi:acyltransferase [Lactiplantibacillus nangangensis]|uniref:Acyltransferase n=1 Tax=Lactiplantibacillus nangangensis TaxID=2559917 RepID=A0ABW1SHY0_9LACO|nr:acyltransferase [Lactiplantibacillus nangangensis]
MRKRYLSMDTLRGLAILGVLLIHVSGLYVSSSWSGLILNQLSRFAVPAFLFLSGWGLTMSGKINIDYLGYIIKQAKRLLVPYVLWSIAYWLVNFKASISIHSIIALMSGLLLGTTKYHLYYIPITFVFYIAYPIFKKIVHSNSGIVLLLLLTIVSQSIGVIGNVGWMIKGQNIFNWMFYFGFGIWMSNDFEEKLHKLENNRIWVSVVGVLSVCLLFFETKMLELNHSISPTTSMKPSVIVYSVSVILIVIAIHLTSSSLMSVGKSSYGIYLAHPMILDGIRKFEAWFGLSLNSILNLLFEFVLVVLFSVVLTKCYTECLHLCKRWSR